MADGDMNPYLNKAGYPISLAQVEYGGGGSAGGVHFPEGDSPYPDGTQFEGVSQPGSSGPNYCPQCGTRLAPTPARATPAAARKPIGPPALGPAAVRPMRAVAKKPGT